MVSTPFVITSHGPGRVEDARAPAQQGGAVRKHIAAMIAYGPEVRSFVHSGMLERLAQNHRITVFAFRPDSAAFHGAGLDVRPLISAPEPWLLRYWRMWTMRACNRWVSKLGAKKWSYYLPDHGQGLRQLARNAFASVLAFRWPIQVMSRIETALASKMGTNAHWRKVFLDLGIDVVIASAYDHRVISALQTATNLGIKTVLVTNNWKAFFASPHLPFQPSAMLLGAECEVPALKRANPWLKTKTIATASSLHLEPFRHRRRVLPKCEFYGEMGLDEGRPYICYTAAAPAAVRNEEQIVAAIASAIGTKRLPHVPQLLVRLNPMEDGRRFAFLESQRQVVIQRPCWEWFPEKDWCCALARDISLWVSTVHYAALNVSIPSTVTVEFASFERPVVNVCFDYPPDPPPDASNVRFWNAPFYAEARSSPLVSASFSPEQLLDLIDQKLRLWVSQRHRANDGDHEQSQPERGAIDQLEALVEKVIQA